MRKAIVLLLAGLLGACNGGGPRSPEGPGGGPIAPHETFLRNPTEIKADEVRVNLPAEYGPELTVKGLSDGWKDDGRLRTWEGTGACSLGLELLKVECRKLSVALVSDQTAPEVMIQANGDVYMGHGVRGVVKYSEGISFLLLRNERSLER